MTFQHKNVKVCNMEIINIFVNNFVGKLNDTRKGHRKVYLHRPLIPKLLTYKGIMEILYAHSNRLV